MSFWGTVDMIIKKELNKSTQNYAGKNEGKTERV